MEELNVHSRLQNNRIAIGWIVGDAVIMTAIDNLAGLRLHRERAVCRGIVGMRLPGQRFYCHALLPIIVSKLTKRSVALSA
ncbi:Uncharacterised protein [Salmonella enterica]|nr:Uncharacterised protein [Salmonella enterica]